MPSSEYTVSQSSRPVFVKTSVNYGEQLEQLMEDLLIVSKIASLSKRVEKGSIRLGDKDIGMRASDFDSQDGSSTVTHPSGQAQRLGSFSNYQSWRRNDVIMNQLEGWDEPESQRENLDRVRASNKTMISCDVIFSHRNELLC